MPSTMAGNAWVVAPFTGAWIEIGEKTDIQVTPLGRSLHGGVD